MTTTGSGSAGPELLEALSWLAERNGILLLRPDEVHVYSGAIHRCVMKTQSAESGVSAVIEAIRQVRLEHGV